MATVIKYTSNEQMADMKSDEREHYEKSEKKLTVLESHGYCLGKTIGAGSYATVKVQLSTLLLFFFQYIQVFLYLLN